jgi:hypothetical protein
MQPIFDAPAPADSSNRVGKALMSIPTFQLRLPSGTRSLLVAVLSVQRFKGTQRRQSLNRTRLSACNCLLICAASLLLGPVSSLACRDIRRTQITFGNKILWQLALQIGGAHLLTELRMSAQYERLSSFTCQGGELRRRVVIRSMGRAISNEFVMCMNSTRGASARFASTRFVIARIIQSCVRLSR